MTQPVSAHLQADNARTPPATAGDIRVSPDGWLSFGVQKWRCALGKGGVIHATAKQEGDGKSPAGQWRLRYVMYRPDRLDMPATSLPVFALSAHDGWCDDPASPDYNRPIRQPFVPSPFAPSHEKLWRDDGLYDIVVALDHNDAPAIPGKGSAIFMHIARPAYDSTEGCVALTRADLLELLGQIPPHCTIRIDC